MQKTKIEWTDYTWNPLTGCTRGCYYCYARVMAHRLQGRCGYPEGEPFRPTFHPEQLYEPGRIRKPSKIFTCSMGELFDPAAEDRWISDIIGVMMGHPRHTFQVLTKQPLRAQAWYLPNNCWLGVSIDARTNGCVEIHQLEDHPSDVLRFVSFEPLLGEIWPDLTKVDWIIIGAQTGFHAEAPEPEWVEGLLEIAAKRKIPVFLKSNLRWHEKRQEWPKKVTEK